MKNLEHVFFTVNHVFHFLPNKPCPKTCPQIYKTQKHSTITLSFFHIPITNTKTFKDSKYLQQTQVLTCLNPNLQTQANPNSQNPKLKTAFLFLTNSDLHFAPLWQQFFQNAHFNNLHNVFVHTNPFVNVTGHKGTIFEFRFISVNKTYSGSPTLISAMLRLLATVVIDNPANVFFFFFFLYRISLEFGSGLM